MSSGNWASSKPGHSPPCSLIPITQGGVVQPIRGVGHDSLNEGVSGSSFCYDCGGPDLPIGLGICVAVDREGGVSKAWKSGCSMALTECPEESRMSLRKECGQRAKSRNWDSRSVPILPVYQAVTVIVGCVSTAEVRYKLASTHWHHRHSAERY